MEKEIEKMKAALEDFGKKVVTAVKKGKGEADKVTRVAQLRIEIGSLNRQVGDLFRELGELFYQNYNKASKTGQEELVETVTHIAAVEKNIAGLRREIKSLRGEKPVPAKGRGKKAAGGSSKGKGGRPKKAAASAKAKSPRRARSPKPAAENPVGTPAEKPKRRGRPPKTKAE